MASGAELVLADVAKALKQARDEIENQGEQIIDEIMRREKAEQILAEVVQLILDSIELTRRNGPVVGMAMLYQGLEISDEVLPRIQMEPLPHDWLSRWKVGAL